MSIAATLVRLAVGSSDDVCEVVWHRDGSTYTAQVPGDDIWVVVKDDVLLREYEWLGADLAGLGGVVIDAGANVGTFTVVLATHASHVVAVEPNPAAVALLEANLAANGHHDVDVVRAALWSHDDGADLDVSRSASSASIVEDRAMAPGITCPTVTLSTLLSDHPAVDLLKIDIEGAEYEVLTTTPIADLRRIRRIVGELHPFGGDPHGLASFLRGAGFEVRITRGPFFRPVSALRALWRNGRDVEGHPRLKAVVAMTLVASIVLVLAPAARRRLAGPDLWYVVADRRDDLEDWCNG